MADLPILIDNQDRNAVSVTAESELMCCLCEPCCENHISLGDLQKQFPGLHISLRTTRKNNGHKPI